MEKVSFRKSQLESIFSKFSLKTRVSPLVLLYLLIPMIGDFFKKVSHSAFFLEVFPARSTALVGLLSMVQHTPERLFRQQIAVPLLQPPAATDFLSALPASVTSLIAALSACLQPIPRANATCFKLLLWQHSLLIPDTVSVTYFCLTNHPEIYLLKNESIIYSAVCYGLGWALLLVSLGVIHATADMWRLLGLDSRVWCLSWRGQDGLGTAGSVGFRRNLSSRVHSWTFYKAAQGSARVKGGAPRPSRASARNWAAPLLSKQAPAHSQGQRNALHLQ